MVFFGRERRSVAPEQADDERFREWERYKKARWQTTGGHVCLPVLVEMGAGSQGASFPELPASVWAVLWFGSCQTV
jgi:hypothetical protein